MKSKVIYKCSQCGNESIRWMGRCSVCGSWNTYEEVLMDGKAGTGKGKKDKGARILPAKLLEIDMDNQDRLITGIHEFNRVMGGGIVKDSITILAARPGAGKSTLLLEISESVGNKGYKVLYASGEESESQIRNRANRILEKIPENIWILSDTSMDNLLETIARLDPDLIIVDSIQTFKLDDLTSRAGSPIQTIECANALVDIGKNKARPRAVIMVGHMTKSNEMAGIRTLEHLVDTVIYLEGGSDEELRTLMATKNRFGSTGEIGLFAMGDKGMKPINDPSQFFLTRRQTNKSIPGSALSIIKEGSRLITVEIESLVSQSFTPYPSRIGNYIKKDQLSTLISILEQRGKINLYDKNVVIKTTGGLRITEQSANLAIIMSIVSSVLDKGIASDIVFIGDVGLTGELKRVPSLEARIRELDRMGYKKVYTYKTRGEPDIPVDSIEVVRLDTLQEIIDDLFY